MWEMLWEMWKMWNKITSGRKAYTKVPDMIICKDDGNTEVFVGEGKTPWKHNIGCLEFLFTNDRNGDHQKEAKLWLGKYLRISSCAISC
jgi:hypothetical protein